jgi:hypothetical protein
MAALIVLVVPASAVAGNSHRRHHARTHHARTHHARTHHARIKLFGSDATRGSMSSSSADTAGAVQSFDNGVLTIVLNDGSTVSGTVNNNTELECKAPEQTQTAHMDGDGSGDDNQAQGSGDQSATEDQGDVAEQNEDSAEDQNENEAAEQNENEAENNCSIASLTQGTVVREAELSISGAGSVWKKVELES